MRSADLKLKRPAHVRANPASARAALCIIAASLLSAPTALAQASAAGSSRSDEYKEHPPLEARVTVEGKDRKITIRGRSASKLGITPGTQESAARTFIDVEKIQEVKFKLDIDLSELNKAIRTKNWALAVRVLRDPIVPALPYLDLNENNAVEYALRLGNFMLRDAEQTVRTSTAENAEELAQAKYKAAYTVYRRLTPVQWHPAGVIGSVKRLLCMLRMNKPKTARHYFKNIEAPMPGDRAYGVYYLVEAELAMQAKDYRAAMGAAVKSLSFETKDIETFPDALLISAQCYEELQQWHRARDVYYEIASIFPSTDWSEVSRRRLKFIMDKEFSQDEETLPIENVFFAWQEDMNEKVTAFLEADEAAVQGAPKGETEDLDIDLDSGGEDRDLDAAE